MLVASSLSVAVMCTTQHKMNIMILWIRLDKQMSVFTPSQLIPVCWYHGGPCGWTYVSNIMILWIRLDKQMSVFTPSQLIPVCWYHGGPCGWTYVSNIFISWLVEKRFLSNFIHIKLSIPVSIFSWCCARDFVYRHNHTSWHSSLNWKLTFWSQERRFFFFSCTL